MGGDIKDGRASVNGVTFINGQRSESLGLTLETTEKGAEKLLKATMAIPLGTQIAFVIDDVVITAPHMNEPFGSGFSATGFETRE